jgi:hypothetical protein
LVLQIHPLEAESYFAVREVEDSGSARNPAAVCLEEGLVWLASASRVMHIYPRWSTRLSLEEDYFGWAAGSGMNPKAVVVVVVVGRQGTWRMAEALEDMIGAACWDIPVVRVGRWRGIVGGRRLLVGLVRVGELVAREPRYVLGLEGGRMVRVLLVEAEMLGSNRREAEGKAQERHPFA